MHNGKYPKTGRSRGLRRIERQREDPAKHTGEVLGLACICSLLYIWRGTNHAAPTCPAGGLQRVARGDMGVNDKVVAVLVVEDDQLIQTIAEEALSDGGFEAVVTTSGEEAIRLLQENKSHYRAVVTDINLSGKLTGWDVARVAREIDPTMPIVYMTGTHGEDWASKGVPNSVLLTKPFAPAQLVTAISNLLNEAGPIAPPTE